MCVCVNKDNKVVIRKDQEGCKKGKSIAGELNRNGGSKPVGK